MLEGYYCLLYFHFKGKDPQAQLVTKQIVKVKKTI